MFFSYFHLFQANYIKTNFVLFDEVGSKQSCK